VSPAWNKLIVALDVRSEKKCKRVIAALAPPVTVFKIGPIAYFKSGPAIIEAVTKKGARVFLDFKFYDIPNTMLEAAKNFIDMNIWAFTVHIKAGVAPLAFLRQELANEAKRKRKPRPLIVGVTELTSQLASRQAVLKLASLAKQARLDGVVCSVWEAKAIKERYGLMTITPGIRHKASGDDQRRVATAQDALKEKADYFVVGRPIVGAKDYRKAAEDILEKKGTHPF